VGAQGGNWARPGGRQSDPRKGRTWPLKRGEKGMNFQQLDLNGGKECSKRRQHRNPPSKKKDKKKA